MKRRPALVAVLAPSALVVLIVALAAIVPIQQARGAFPGDNGRIAFAGKNTIQTIKPDGTKRRRVTRHEKGQTDSEPAFSPNGRRIAFVRDFFRGPPRDEKSRIYITRANGSNLHKLKPRRRPRPRYYRNPAFSPSGKRIVFQGFIRRLGWAIYMIKTDGTRLKLLTARRNRFEADSSPTVSPNGERIAFDGVRVRQIGPQRVHLCNIYVMRADGRGETNLTDNDNDCDLDPTFSPDGSEIAFRSDGPCSVPPDPQVCVMRADGTDVRSIGPGESPSFSPNGRKIAFEIPDTGSGVSVGVMRADGSDRQRLVPGSEPDWGVRP